MSDGSGSKSVDLRDLARVLWRRRLLFLVPWAVAVVVGVSGALLLRPMWFSSVTLLHERAQQLSGSLGSVGGGSNPEAQADVMREQVKSSLFLTSVITATGIRSDPGTRAWALKSARKYIGMSESQVIDQFLIGHLRDGITIRRAKGNVFQITVGDFDRDRARLVAEGVANQLVLYSKASQIEAARSAQEFSEQQKEVYKQQLEEAERKLEAFRRNVLSTSVIGSTVGQLNLPRARTLLEQASFEADDLRARITSLRAQFAGKVQPNDPLLLTTPQVAGMASQITTLERQMAGTQLNDGTPENQAGSRLSIARKRAELEVELNLSAARVLPQLPEESRKLLVDYRLAQVDLAGAEASRDWLVGQVANYERSVVQTPDREIEQQRLSQEVENKSALYNNFLQQSIVAQIAEAFENAKVSGRFLIIEPATRPLTPGKPNRPVLILLSLVVGTIIGGGTVLVVEHHDQSVRNAEEVESLLGLPVIGMIPRVAELERSRRRPRAPRDGVEGVPAPREHGLLHRLKVESPLGLEFRRTYLKLAKSRSRQLPRTLVVTSSTRGEGKTTTTACLAITLARELGQKVLLVDFDLRSPALHRALGLPSSTWGLAQMLGQRHFDERFVRSTVLPNLEFLPAGRGDRPAAELIDTGSVEWFVKEAASRYSMVIMDTAPNLAVPDPLILGRAVEGVLYVVKAGSTVRKSAEYGVKIQREAQDNVLGVLINDAGEILPHYYGYRDNYYGYTTESVSPET